MLKEVTVMKMRPGSQSLTDRNHVSGRPELRGKGPWPCLGITSLRSSVLSTRGPVPPPSTAPHLTPTPTSGAVSPRKQLGFPPPGNEEAQRPQVVSEGNSVSGPHVYRSSYSISQQACVTYPLSPIITPTSASHSPGFLYFP